MWQNTSSNLCTLWFKLSALIKNAICVILTKLHQNFWSGICSQNDEVCHQCKQLKWYLTFLESKCLLKVINFWHIFWFLKCSSIKIKVSPKWHLVRKIKRAIAFWICSYYSNSSKCTPFSLLIRLQSNKMCFKTSNPLKTPSV